MCSRATDLSPHLRLSPKRRHHIDHPHLAPALPFHGRQLRVARIDSLRHDLIDQCPHRDADRLFAL
jgi:hypothetical protein